VRQETARALQKIGVEIEKEEIKKQEGEKEEIKKEESKP